MEPQPKMSATPRPARKSLEPSPAAWTRTCLRFTVSNGVFEGTAPEVAAIELAAAIRIAVAARAVAVSEAVSLSL